MVEIECSHICESTLYTVKYQTLQTLVVYYYCNHSNYHIIIVVVIFDASRNQELVGKLRFKIHKNSQDVSIT